MNLRGSIVRLIGNKEQEHFDSKKIKRVLLPGGRIGDIIVKTPMLETLYGINKEVKIDISTDMAGSFLLKNCPYIGEVLLSKTTRHSKIVKIYKSLSWAMKHRGKYDLFFDFTNSPRFFHILFLRILKPRFLIGCYRAEKFGIKRDELTIFDKYVEVMSGEHAMDINMKFLEVLGIDTKNKKYELYLGEYEDKYKDYFKRDNFNIVFNFKGSAEKRTLNIDEIKSLLEKIPRIEKNIRIYIITIPEDRETIKELLKNYPMENVELLPKTENILEACGLLKYSDMLLSVDTGLVHIASVFNIPIVGIYPKDENNFKLFAPRSDMYEIIRGTEEGSSVRGFSEKEVIEKVLILKEKVNEKKSSI